MKRIIDGVTYNTDTATLVARKMKADLYLTLGRAFFLVESGDEGADPTFVPLTREQAWEWYASGQVQLIEDAVFDEAAEEVEPGATIYVRLPRTLKDTIEVAAKEDGVCLTPGSCAAWNAAPMILSSSRCPDRTGNSPIYRR